MKNTLIIGRNLALAMTALCLIFWMGDCQKNDESIISNVSNGKNPIGNLKNGLNDFAMTTNVSYQDQYTATYTFHFQIKLAR